MLAKTLSILIIFLAAACGSLPMSNLYDASTVKTDERIKADFAAGLALLAQAEQGDFQRTKTNPDFAALPPVEQRRLRDKDGLSLHYFIAPQSGSKAIVVFVPGFSEHFRKYSELIYDLSQQGYSVAGFDLRAMGASQRYPHNSQRHQKLLRQTVHINNFRDYAKDLEFFVEHMLATRFPDQPIYIFAHSTGGLVTLDYMASVKKPTVQKLFLNSPLFKVRMTGFEGFVTGWISSALTQRFPPRPKQEVVSARNFRFADQKDTDHQQRWQLYTDYLIEHEDVLQNAPSRGWIGQARFTTENEKRRRFIIQGLSKVPTILISAGTGDTFVDTTVHDSLVGEAQELPDAQLEIVKFPRARHSIWRGQDYERVLEMLQGFLQ